jgi:hypothetical protein
VNTGNSGVAERLAASQEGLSSMELVSCLAILFTGMVVHCP